MKKKKGPRTTAGVINNRVDTKPNLNILKFFKCLTPAWGLFVYSYPNLT